MISRRGYFGYAACACMATDSAFAAPPPLPPGYTSPTYVPESGKAPGMQAQVISGKSGGPRTWAVIFSNGDEVMSGLSDWMQQERISGGHLTAMGAYSSALFGWFDKDKRAYRNIVVGEQVEGISLIGDIGLVDGKPALHVNGCVGHPDGSVRGGHLPERRGVPDPGGVRHGIRGAALQAAGPGDDARASQTEHLTGGTSTISDDIRVTAFLHAKPGQEVAVMEAAAACVAPTRAESGNGTYLLHQDMKDPALLVFLEHWKSRQALDEHMQTPHFGRLGDACNRRLVEPIVVHVLRPL